MSKGNNVIRYGSVCSGIEAATSAWHSLGWQPSFFSEIEAFPRAVLAHHYPNVPLHGDFTTIGADDYDPIDLLVGGTPCQSFSIAGLRGGLDDDRGNLALEFLRLADRTRPRWVVWENVPGVLSSNGGRDFGSILGGLGEVGYGWAYRVLDAQYFGVAQRRRRVFVVGYLGDWRPAAAVLFERHSLSGHPAPSREARKDAARATASGAEERGGCGGGGLAVVGTLTATGPTTMGAPEVDGGHYIPVSVNAGCPLFVPESVGTLRTRRPGEGGDHGADAGINVCPTIRKSGDGGGDMPAIAFEWQRGATQNLELTDNFSPALIKSQTPAVAFGIDDVAHCLRSGASKADKPDSTTYVVASAVRRLTPRECERLQGFPDDWTMIPYRNKPADQCPDGPRYKALGNSMAAPVMRWIGERIAAVDAIIMKGPVA